MRHASHTSRITHVTHHTRHASHTSRTLDRIRHDFGICARQQKHLAIHLTLHHQKHAPRPLHLSVDLDGDGVLSRTEVQQSLESGLVSRKAVMSMDVDGDGDIDSRDLEKAEKIADMH